MPLSKCRWLVLVDDALQRHGTPSQTGPASTPEAIQDQQSSGGSLREVWMLRTFHAHDGVSDGGLAERIAPISSLSPVRAGHNFTTRVGVWTRNGQVPSGGGKLVDTSLTSSS